MTMNWVLARRWLIANAVGLFIGASLSGAIAGISLSVVAAFRAGQTFDFVAYVVFGAILGVLYSIVAGAPALKLVLISVPAGGNIIGTLVTCCFMLSVTGIFVGLFQWSVIRTEIGRGVKWVAATAIGWGVAGILGGLLADFEIMQVGVAIGIVSGLVSGVLQWSILSKKYPQLRLWVLTSIVGWALGCGLSAISPTGAGLFLGGAIAGIVSGWPLIQMRQNSQTKVTV